jgi:hypothetical protein
MEAIRQFWAGIVVAGLLFFLDAPFRTFGQKFVVVRARERWILLSLEADLWILWAIARFAFHWDAVLVPAAAAAAAAAVAEAAAGSASGRRRRRDRTW